VLRERGKNVGGSSRIPKGHDHVGVIELVYRVTPRGVPALVSWREGEPPSSGHRDGCFIWS
jgi:hypothetical protein